MLASTFDAAGTMFASGGWVMWPLLALSLISVTLTVERLVFWSTTNRPGRDRWLSNMADRLRQGDKAAARAMIAKDGSVYAQVTGGLLDRGASEAVAIELVERHRRPCERFSTTLSTIITAAPLLGILGTVTGIIQSFRLLGIGGDAPVTDPAMVASGIAEALITTAFGLVVATFTLFPYAWFRASADRTLGRLEGLVAAAAQWERATATPRSEAKPARVEAEATR